MAALTEVRDSIKTTLESAISGLHVYARVPESPNLPCVIAMPVDADFTVAMARGTDTWEFDLVVLASTAADHDVAQADLDQMVDGHGDRSIRQAIFTAKTLGLSGVDAHVAGMAGYGSTYDAVGVPHVGARLRLVVHKKGTA